MNTLYNQDLIFRFFNHLFFILIGIVMIYPFWYVVMFSISEPAKASFGCSYIVPEGLSFSVYTKVFNTEAIFYGLKNSIFIVLIGTSISLILTAFTAYPLTKESLKGRKLIFLYIVFTMIFWGGLIPTYIVIRAFGLVDTLWALMLINAVSVYNMLIMMKFFKNIPASLIESARIDGYNDIAIFIKIVLPLSKAVIAAVGLFYAVYLWNAYLPGLIYINNPVKRPIQVVLYSMIKETEMASEMGMTDNLTTESFRMAAIVISTVPIIMVYPFLQKHFIKGIMLGSVKE